MATSDDILLDDSPAPLGSGGSPAAQTFDEEEETLVTKEGLKKLKEELEHLKNVRRKEISQRLKEAISYGDLSENSEYEEAKNEQAFIEGRILELERKIKNAKIIVDHADKTMSRDANIGSQVTIRNISESSEEHEVVTIVGATEADPFGGKISNESPVGKALIGAVKGDRVIAHTPSGPIEYEVVKVA